jgi:hypothetical protein
MIVGGYKKFPDKETLTSVELFNWKTGEQCYLDEFPHPVRGHSGAVINGDPHICGGTFNETTQPIKLCYKHNKESLEWEPVSFAFESLYE